MDQLHDKTVWETCLWMRRKDGLGWFDDAASSPHQPVRDDVRGAAPGSAVDDALGDTNARKGYIRSIVDAVEVDDKAIRIIGNKDVLQAVIAGKQNANGNVRGFVRKWRTRHDFELVLPRFVVRAGPLKSSRSVAVRRRFDRYK